MNISLGYHNFLSKLCGKIVCLLCMSTWQFLNGANKNNFKGNKGIKGSALK